MIRTQIQLSPHDHTQLKRFAAERGVSLSEAVRRAVRLLLDREANAPTRAMLVREALSVAGKYGDPEGREDVAEEHDRYLAEAYDR
jgi:Arc/MetJ-type ribon-helix-helix transcriptional regulator